jgi:hypothetical protein
MFIQTNRFTINKIEIIDVLGHIVISKAIDNSANLVMPLSLPNGLYIVKISNDKEIRKRKIIIKNN